MLKINAQAYGIEAANPRHEHEWMVWKDVKLPDGKILIPGFISQSTNVVEHPELVSWRIQNFASVVGKENVIAGRGLRLLPVLGPDPLSPEHPVGQAGVAGRRRSAGQQGALETLTSRSMDGLLWFSGAVKRDPSIDIWLGEQDPELGAIARRWFVQMRERGDDVRELMHDGCPVACVGDAPFGYVNVFRAHVNVGFFLGAELDDPAGLLEGRGRRMRHVKVRPGHRPQCRRAERPD